MILEFSNIELYLLKKSGGVFDEEKEALEIVAVLGAADKKKELPVYLLSMFFIWIKLRF